MKNPQREVVTIEYAREQLTRIGERVPRILAILKIQTREDGKTTGQFWSENMAGLDKEYFTAIVDPYVKMVLKVPEDGGSLGSDIIEQTRLLEARASERANTERITTYEKSNSEWDRLIQTDEAVTRGTIFRVGRWIMSRESSEQQREELFAWASGKLPRPVWFTAEDLKYLLDDKAPKLTPTML